MSIGDVWFYLWKKDRGLKKNRPTLVCDGCSYLKLYEYDPEIFHKLHRLCENCSRYYECEADDYVYTEEFSEDCTDEIVDDLFEWCHAKAKAAYGKAWNSYYYFDDRED